MNDMSKTQGMVRDYLTRRDGAITRDGKAMARLSKTTGYSVESLRSIAYGRREPDTSTARGKKLVRTVRRG